MPDVKAGRSLSWEPAEGDGLADDHERFLSDDIAERLVKSKRGRYFEEDDPISSFSMEFYLPRRGGRRGFADIVLVSREHVKPTPVGGS